MPCSHSHSHLAHRLQHEHLDMAMAQASKSVASEVTVKLDRKFQEIFSRFQNTNMDSALPFSFWMMSNDRVFEMRVYKAFCKANGTCAPLHGSIWHGTDIHSRSLKSWWPKIAGLGVQALRTSSSYILHIPDAIHLNVPFAMLSPKITVALLDISSFKWRISICWLKMITFLLKEKPQFQ